MSAAAELTTAKVRRVAACAADASEMVAALDDAAREGPALALAIGMTDAAAVVQAIGRARAELATVRALLMRLRRG